MIYDVEFPSNPNDDDTCYRASFRRLSVEDGIRIDAQQAEMEAIANTKAGKTEGEKQKEVLIRYGIMRSFPLIVTALQSFEEKKPGGEWQKVAIKERYYLSLPEELHKELFEAAIAKNPHRSVDMETLLKAILPFLPSDSLEMLKSGRADAIPTDAKSLNV